VINLKNISCASCTTEFTCNGCQQDVRCLCLKCIIKEYEKGNIIKLISLRRISEKCFSIPDKYLVLYEL
jgi:hypothetical protein